jgi:HEAT repeat protein
MAMFHRRSDKKLQGWLHPRRLHTFRAVPLVAVLLFFSCRTTTDLVLDDPVFFEDMVDAALNGEKFKITPEDYPDIRALLQDENPEHRMAGVILASQTGDEALYPDIIDAALDEDSDVSGLAEKLILENRGSFRPFLLDTLNSDDPSRRSGALILLSRLGGEDVVPVLIDFFNDPDPDVRNQASLSVREITGRNNPLLREALDSSDPLTAAIAYRTLGRYTDPDDAPVFISAFASEDPGIRREAQLAALRLGEEGLIFLHVAAGNPGKPYRVRLSALEVIQGLRSTDSLEFLLGLLDDEDERIRLKAETILGTYGSEAIPALTELYNASEVKNRVYAVQQMGEIGSKAAIPVLVSALGDTSREVRNTAMDALRGFGEEAWPVLHDNLSEQGLVLLREEADPWLVSLENGEPNISALFLLITGSGMEDLEAYLNKAEISKLTMESILSLKKAWHTAEEFSILDALIAEGRNPYLLLWRQRELNMVAARDMLRQSFMELHAYFETRDPSVLDKAGETRGESRRLEKLAREQKAALDRLDEEQKASGEILLGRYREMRESLVRTWEYVIPSLLPLAEQIYAERGVDPESLVSELALIE